MTLRSRSLTIARLGRRCTREFRGQGRARIQAAVDRYRFIKGRRRVGQSLEVHPQEILDAPYVFVLSTGRCGTALLTKVLKRSPQLLVEHAPKPELEWVSSLVHQNQPSMEALRLAVLAARFDAFFQHAFERNRIYVETNNRISLFAPALAELLPRSRFIHLVRHPAGFVRSGMRRNYYADGTQHQRLIPREIEGWSQWSRLEKIAWEWNEINARIEAFKSECAPDRVMTLTSEALFAGHKGDAIATLWPFIGVPDPFADKRGRRRLEKLFRQPVNEQISGNFPKYSDWPEADRAALRNTATLAPRYGYEML